MQLIAETYSLMQHALGPVRAADGRGLHRAGTQRDLDSYLIEITANVLAFTDPDTGNPLVDVILDKAGQKGTGPLDVPGRPGAWHADPDHRRGRLGAQHLVVQGRARAGQRDPEGARRARRPVGRRRRLREGSGSGALGGQGQQLRPGSGAAPGVLRRARLRPEPLRDRPDLDGRLHHPREAAGGDPVGVHVRSGPAEPDALAGDRAAHERADAARCGRSSRWRATWASRSRR